MGAFPCFTNTYLFIYIFFVNAMCCLYLSLSLSLSLSLMCSVDWRCVSWISILSCLERLAWRPRKGDQSIGCLMMFPNNFLIRTVSNNDLFVSATCILNTSSFVTRLFQLILTIRLSIHISTISRHCCVILLMVHVSTPYSSVDQTKNLMNLSLDV